MPAAVTTGAHRVRFSHPKRDTHLTVRIGVDPWRQARRCKPLLARYDDFVDRPPAREDQNDTVAPILIGQSRF
jgi:hypothetical protein